jgi:hydroxypyruvate reductase
VSPAQAVRHRDQPVGLVRPETGELTVDLARFRRDLPAIFRAALDRSSAAALLESALHRPDVRRFLARKLRLLSIGKAAAHLAAAFDRLCPGAVADGLVIGTHRAGGLPSTVTWIESSHPVPDVRSVDAAARALEGARTLAPGHGLLVLLSGGASSLMALPAAGITLEDKRAATRQLLGVGAAIHDLNAVRKHLSAVKGGQLAAAAAGPVLALAISDVVGDDLSVIGSGPTVADPSTFADALAVVGRFGGPEAFPSAVVARLRAGARGEVEETPKPGDARLERSVTEIVGSRRDAAAGAASAARSLGYQTIVIDEPVVGLARDAGPRVVENAVHRAGPGDDAVCVIATGETTVRVTGRGRGGRNQEVVLSAARTLAALPTPAAFLSGGTDGVDGPTDAAGAVADGMTLARAERAGLRSPEVYLDDNDAYRFFGALGDLVITGPSETNVGDIQVLLIAPRGGSAG